MNTYPKAASVWLILWCVLAAVRAVWAEQTPAPADTAPIQAIQQAPDPSAAVTAYANGIALDRHDPKLYEAYVARMVDLGLPELAYHQAQTLTTLQSSNGLAWGVVAYVDARRGQMADAISAINLAGQFAPENKFVAHTAGELARLVRPQGRQDNTARKCQGMAWPKSGRCWPNKPLSLGLTTWPARPTRRKPSRNCHRPRLRRGNMRLPRKARCIAGFGSSRAAGAPSRIAGRPGRTPGLRGACPRPLTIRTIPILTMAGRPITVMIGVRAGLRPRHGAGGSPAAFGVDAAFSRSGRPACLAILTTSTAGGFWSWRPLRARRPLGPQWGLWSRGNPAAWHQGAQGREQLLRDPGPAGRFGDAVGSPRFAGPWGRDNGVHGHRLTLVEWRRRAKPGLRHPYRLGPVEVIVSAMQPRARPRRAPAHSAAIEPRRFPAPQSMQRRTGRRQAEAPTALALSGLFMRLAEALPGAAFAQAVSAADFTALAVPSGVDSMEAASGAAATGVVLAVVATGAAATAKVN